MKLMLLFLLVSCVILTSTVVSAITKECLKEDVLKPELENYFATGTATLTSTEMRRLMDLYSISGGAGEVSIESSSISETAKNFITTKCTALLKNTGETCRLATECKTNVCNNQVCAPQQCTLDSDCKSNERCATLDRGFIKSLIASISALFGRTDDSLDRICIAKTSYLKGVGETCTARSECESGFCLESKCALQPCSTNSDCQTGTCSSEQTKTFVGAGSGFGSAGVNDVALGNSLVNSLKTVYPEAEATSKRECTGTNDEGSRQTCTTTVSYKACSGLGY